MIANNLRVKYPWFALFEVVRDDKCLIVITHKHVIYV